MFALDHVIEIALLILVAYLLGCVAGYAAHALFLVMKARPQFVPGVQVQAAAQVLERAASPPPPKSAARRLAGTVEREATSKTDLPVQTSLQRPADLPAPRHGKPDDLKKIKGIGAKTESALNDLGIYHLDQIAAWSQANVDWLEGRIAVKGRIRREQWVEQAILLVTATTHA